jgi:hypothetical protein
MILITNEHFILMWKKFQRKNIESEFVLSLISSESFERNCVKTFI